MSQLTLPDATFTRVAAFLKERSGLTITIEKLYLLETRLQPVAEQHHFTSVRAMLEALAHGTLLHRIQDDIVEAMTTNESLFMRDAKPFDALITTMLPALGAQGVHEARIWSAACSTGQEPYSIAMKIADSKALLPDIQIRITASDLSPKVVERAKEGIFSHFEVQRGLPVTYLLKYFTQLDKNHWQVKPTIAGQVQFSVQNLLAPFAAGSQCHIVFCRYVLIYFDEATRADIIQRIAAIIPQSGYLVLGASETIRPENAPLFIPVDGLPGIYVKQ